MLQLLFTQTLLLAAHIEEKKVIKSTFEQLISYYVVHVIAVHHPLAYVI